MHRLIILFILSLICMAVALPDSACAQDSIEELEFNINAQKYSRKSLGSRIGAEFGLGMAGLAVGVGGLLGMIPLYELNDTVAIVTGITFGLGTPALIATGVYYGGVLTGGRSSTWAPFAGAYITSLIGVIGGLCLFDGLAHKISSHSKPVEITLYTLLGIGAAAVIFLGPILGYELSDSHNTDALKKKRNNLSVSRDAVMPMPMVPTILKFSF